MTLTKYSSIAERLGRFSSNYTAIIEWLQGLAVFFKTIKPEGKTTEPVWVNGFLPPADACVLCAMLNRCKPRTYMEIGSGNSTKFAAAVIRDQKLPTHIVSIDPQPRVFVDVQCNECIRSEVQDVEPEVFEQLGPDDILFVDSSHRSEQNSDVNYICLEILPRLKQGVLVHFHDVFLPQDYGEDWLQRHFNEQYLLGVLLLFGAEHFEVLYSASFVKYNRQLRRQLETTLAEFLPEGSKRHGASLWLRKVK